MARYSCFLRMPDELKSDRAFDADAYARADFDVHLKNAGLTRNEPWRLSWTMERQWYEDRYGPLKWLHVWWNTKVLWRLHIDADDPRTYHEVTDWACRGVTDIGPPDQKIPYIGMTRPPMAGPVPDNRDINWEDYMTGDNE